MLYIFKRGSSVLFVIASAIRLPLVDFFLLIPWLAGEARQKHISVYDWFALFAIVRSSFLQEILLNDAPLSGARYDRILLPS
jgi:hypothetical protein